MFFKAWQMVFSILFLKQVRKWKYAVYLAMLNGEIGIARIQEGLLVFTIFFYLQLLSVTYWQFKALFCMRTEKHQQTPSLSCSLLTNTSMEERSKSHYSPSWPVGVVSSYGTSSHIKGYSSLCCYAQWYCKWVSAAVRCSYCA